MGLVDKFEGLGGSPGGQIFGPEPLLLNIGYELGLAECRPQDSSNELGSVPDLPVQKLHDMALELVFRA